MRNFAVRSLVIILVGCLAGCSVLFTYRNVERVVRWSLDDYVDWTPAQADQLRQRLQVQLQWHRQTQLPRYQAWLQAMRDAVQRPLDIAFLRAQSDRLQQFWHDGMAQVQGDIAAQLAELSDAQAAGLIAKIRSDHAELEETYRDLDRDELIERRSREMRKAMRYLFGSLDDDQRAQIERWAAALPDTRQQWLASRQRWTDRFEQALRQRHRPDIFAGQIHRLFVEPRQSWDPAYRELAEQNLNATLQLLVNLQHSLSERQRRALDRRIGQWQGRLAALAASS